MADNSTPVSDPFVVIAAPGATANERARMHEALTALLAPRTVVVLPSGSQTPTAADRLDLFRCAALQGVIVKWAWGGVTGETEEERARMTREADAHMVKRAEEIARAMMAEVDGAR